MSGELGINIAPFELCIDQAMRASQVADQYMPALSSIPQDFSCALLSVGVLPLAAIFFDQVKKAFSYFGSSSIEVKKVPLTPENKKEVNRSLRAATRGLEVVRKIIQRKRSDDFDYVLSIIEDLTETSMTINKKYCAGENVLYEASELKKDVDYLKKEVEEDIRSFGVDGFSYGVCSSVDFWASQSATSVLLRGAVSEVVRHGVRYSK